MFVTETVTDFISEKCTVLEVEVFLSLQKVIHYRNCVIFVWQVTFIELLQSKHISL